MNGDDGAEGRESAAGARALGDRLWRSQMPLGAALVAISAFVFVFTFPFRLTHHILIESLLPVFGVAFALAYEGAQLVMLGLMRSCKGLVIALVLFAAAAGLAWIGMNTGFGYADVEVEGFTAPRHILCSGAVISGFGIGLALLKGWIEPPK